MNPRPNIIWISIDSVRWDRTSMANHTRDTTPHIQQIANQSTVRAFENCITHGFSTRTATASMFTARHPGNHGVSTLANTQLSSSIPTLAEVLARNGYYTAAVSTNAHISPETDLDRGFEDFTWIHPWNIRDIGVQPLFKFLFNIRRHSVGFERELSAHSPALFVNEIATRYIRNSIDRDSSFLFVHYNGPHTPYYPPLPWFDQYLGEFDITTKEAQSLTKQAHYWKQPNKESAFNKKIAEWDEEQQDILRALYDAELRYTDEMVGRLYEYISNSHLDDTIVVITSDHGELLGERGLFHHGGYPLEPLINVPLIVDGIEGLPCSEDLLQHADLTHILGEEASEQIPGSDGIDIRQAHRNFAITQAFNPPIVSVRSKDFKYVKVENEEYFHRLSDEEIDIKDQMPRKFKEHKDIAEKTHHTVGKAAELSDQAEQQLKNLGYKV